MILRLRGRTTLGATFFTVVAGYTRRLSASGGALYLTGLAPEVVERWEGSGYAQRAERVHLCAATPRVGESTLAAFQDARAHVVRPVDPD